MELAPGTDSVRTRTPEGSTVRRTKAPPDVRKDVSGASSGNGTGWFIADEPTDPRAPTAQFPQAHSTCLELGYIG
ncbi:hypothetical protein GCM10009706_15510 [Curtobacterium citreum]|nr:hypothetical protein GCM10009706_15510 [Curtobacterium citreum]